MAVKTCTACIAILAMVLLLSGAAIAQTSGTPSAQQPKSIYYPQSSQPSYYPSASAKQPAPAASAPPASAPAAAPLKPEELEQLVAPIALYPDSLLAQVFMAATYPLEVVQADREIKKNPALKDQPDAMNKLPWDPSVKSLLNFPQVLAMMSEKLDWTVKLGDAFIADQKSVMDAVQRLRNKAYSQGNLQSNDQQKVTVQPTTAPSAGGSASSQVIVVQSASPDVVYVPTYNPTVVYGNWPYPAYPPAYYYPPGYVAGTAMLSFGIGVACGAAWGHAWGDCDWNGGDVDVDIDRNVNFNGNIDRDKYKAERDARQTERQGNRDTRQTDRQGNRDSRQANRGGGGATKFQHDPAHRQGVSYRDQATTEQFRGQNASRQTAQARDSYRGRAEAGRADLNRSGASAYRGNAGAGTGAGAGAGARTGAGAGAGAGTGSRGGGVSSASGRGSTGTRSSGFSGSNSSGSSARAASSRGQASRSSPGYSGSRGGGYSGGSRGGGGGARGGGGRGGGGRR